MTSELSLGGQPGCNSFYNINICMFNIIVQNKGTISWRKGSDEELEGSVKIKLDNKLEPFF